MQAYAAADRDGSGGIGIKETRLLIKYLIFYDDAWEMFRDLDVNADGVVSEAEFVKGIGLVKDLSIKHPKAVFLCVA